MSGEALRRAAIDGDYERLTYFLKGIANPCSCDEYGISPLMYAVWNGHTECVKLLVSNDMGVNRKGQKGSSLNLVSSRGYSALHLAVIDCPPWSMEETIFLLLAVNINPELKCSEGKSAMDLAVERNNEIALRLLQRFAEQSDELLEEVTALRKDLAEHYSFRKDSTVYVTPFKANFPVPKFLFQQQRVGSLPRELRIYEHHIERLAHTGYEKMRGSDSVHCLEFTLKQAESNRERREKLIRSFDEKWEPIPAPSGSGFQQKPP